MARPKGSHDVSPQIRGGLMRYFKMQEAKGRPISTIWEELFEADPMGAMRLAISTMPKEQRLEVTERTVADFVLEKARQREADERDSLH